MDQELQRFGPLFPRGAPVGEHTVEDFNAIHHAIVVVGRGSLVPARGREAVPLVGEAGGVLRDVHKMPVVGLVTLRANLVRPVCDRYEADITDQGLNAFLRFAAQAGLSQCRDDPVPFRSPAEQRTGVKQDQEDGDKHRLLHGNLCPSASAFRIVSAPQLPSSAFLPYARFARSTRPPTERIVARCDPTLERHSKYVGYRSCWFPPWSSFFRSLLTPRVPFRLVRSPVR